MPASVLLLHIPPGRQPHLDWLIPYPNATPDHQLITFRLNRLPWDLPPGESLTATRIPDHRAVYLDYEGDLTESRGLIRRLARPRTESREATPDLVRFDTYWSSDPTRYEATRTLPHPDRWVISRPT